MVTLKEAIAVIKKGDKVRGKTLLLDVLKEQPKNDKAWVWMSAVMDKDELRYECLEEAIRINPDNKLAQKGLERLSQSIPTANKKTSFPAIASIEPKEAHQETTSITQTPTTTQKINNLGFIEYLSKRLIIEKYYAVLALDENLTVPVLNPDNFSVSIPIEFIPELSPLQDYFDLILFRETGSNFDAILIKEHRTSTHSDSITQDELVKVGQACLKYSNIVFYVQKTTMPVKLQIWEIFERGFSSEDQQRLQKLKRIPGTKQVGIQVQAVDIISRKTVYSSTWFNFLGHRRYIQKLLNQENSFVEKDLLTARANSRIEILPILAGIIFGSALGLGGRLLAASLDWDYHFTIDTLIVFLVAAIAIYIPKFKHMSHWQGGLASLGFGITLYAILLPIFGYFDYDLIVAYLVQIFVFVVIGRFAGVVVEP